MRLTFNEDKTVQAAAYLIAKLGGGKINYMKLLKLLYLADRESLIRWGRPITFDSFFAMDHGMVLSHTFDRINGEEKESEKWDQIFRHCGNYQLQLLNPRIGTNELSKVEVQLLDEIIRKFGQCDQWELSELHHGLPEWIDPRGSSIPLDVSDLLEKATEKTPAEIEAIKRELESETIAASLFGE